MRLYLGLPLWVLLIARRYAPVNNQVNPGQLAMWSVVLHELRLVLPRGGSWLQRFLVERVHQWIDRQQDAIARLIDLKVSAWVVQAK